jgi:hypothetical protein
VGYAVAGSAACRPQPIDCLNLFCKIEDCACRGSRCSGATQPSTRPAPLHRCPERRELSKDERACDRVSHAERIRHCTLFRKAADVMLAVTGCSRSAVCMRRRTLFHIIGRTPTLLPNLGHGPLRHLRTLVAKPHRLENHLFLASVTTPWQVG